MCLPSLIVTTHVAFANFVALLSTLVVIFYYQDVNPSLKPIDVPQSAVKEQYDFIIVGGGTAGSVLAGRLTEVKKWSVLLIEAGGDEDAATDAPALAIFLCRSKHDWNYTTVEQKYVCRDADGKCAYPLGRVLGGSSTIGYLLHVRGNQEDYNEWASMGNSGWSYDNILKYFIKMENTSFYPTLLNWTTQDMAIRGNSGPQTVQYARTTYSATELLLEGAKDLGYVVGDYNGVNQSRINYAQLTVNGQSRTSAAKSYLNPVRRRANLSVIKHSFVTRLHINRSGTVELVEYVRDNKYHHVRPRKEVILSAGAINTPKLLMLSGIGPSADLQSLDIPLVKDLPVGENLQDHPLAFYIFSTSLPPEITRQQFFSKKSALDYAKFGKGPLTTSHVELMGFRSLWQALTPNAQLIAGSIPSPKLAQKLIVGSVLLKPKSRGSVRLITSNPFDPPLIDPNFLADDYDKKIMKFATREAIQMFQTPSLKEIDASIEPDDNEECRSYVRNVEEFTACIIRRQSISSYHPCCTARMGLSNDSTTVVDGNLMVHGMRNLRVIDASIMPSVTTGNTNAPTMMIAEKAADIIKSFYGEIPLSDAFA